MNAILRVALGRGDVAEAAVDLAEHLDIDVEDPTPADDPVTPSDAIREVARTSRRLPLRHGVYRVPERRGAV